MTYPSHGAHNHTQVRITSLRECYHPGWWVRGILRVCRLLLRKERETPQNNSDHGDWKLDQSEEPQIQRAGLEGRACLLEGGDLLSMWIVRNTKVIMSLCHLRSFRGSLFMNTEWIPHSLTQHIRTCQKLAFTYFFLDSSLTTPSERLSPPAAPKLYFLTSHVLSCFSSLEHALPSPWNPHLSSLSANSYWHFKTNFPATLSAIHQQASSVLSMSWHLPLLWFQVTLFVGTVDLWLIQPLFSSSGAFRKNCITFIPESLIPSRCSMIVSWKMKGLGHHGFKSKILGLVTVGPRILFCKLVRLEP